MDPKLYSEFQKKKGMKVNFSSCIAYAVWINTFVGVICDRNLVAVGRYPVLSGSEYPSPGLHLAGVWYPGSLYCFHIRNSKYHNTYLPIAYTNADKKFGKLLQSLPKAFVPTSLLKKKKYTQQGLKARWDKNPWNPYYRTIQIRDEDILRGNYTRSK